MDLPQIKTEPAYHDDFISDRGSSREEVSAFEATSNIGRKTWSVLNIEDIIR